MDAEMVAIKLGDVVQEVAGGPLMTVRAQGNGWVDCQWFVGGELKVARFGPSRLCVIEKPAGPVYTPTGDDERRVEEIARAVRASVGPKKLEPLNDCVVFRAVDATRTEAGLYVPDKVETRKRAIVVAVGPGRLREDGEREPMLVRVGDHIVLWADSPTPGGVDHTGEVLYICRESAVACRVVAVEEPS